MSEPTDVPLVLEKLMYGGLTSLEFDATETDINYFTAEVGFKYTIYDITNLSGKDL